MVDLFKKEISAWFPLAMSGAVFSLILVYVSMFGVSESQDEEAPARIFQLVLFGQLLIIGFFAIKWLPSIIVLVIIVGFIISLFYKNYTGFSLKGGE